MEDMVAIHPAEGRGYWAEIPALPGCFTQAETIEELLTRAPEAIESHVQALREDGQAVPDEQLVIAVIRLREPSAA